jgi:hypothetical protein
VTTLPLPYGSAVQRFYMYIGAHVTDGCGGAGDCNNNNNNNNKVILIVVLIKITTDFIFMTVFPEIV